MTLDPPLAQRVALRYHLEALSEDDTMAYVSHRLRLAGSEAPLFEDGGLRAVHRYTSGIPRLINTLCDNILLEMYFGRRPTADATLVTQVAQNLALGEFAPAYVAREPVAEPQAVAAAVGEDALVAVERESADVGGAISPEALAQQVAIEPLWNWQEDRRPAARRPKADASRLRLPENGVVGTTSVDIEDPLAFLSPGSAGAIPAPLSAPVEPAPVSLTDDELAAEAAFMASVGADDEGPAIASPATAIELASVAAELPDYEPSATSISPATSLPVVAPALAPKPAPKGIDLDEIDSLLADLRR